jgi:hypothetical protein
VEVCEDMLMSSIRSLSFDLVGTVEFGALNLELVASDSTVLGGEAGVAMRTVPPADSRIRSNFTALPASTTLFSDESTLEMSFLFSDEAEES